jgi:hypothetical protein
MSESIRDGAPGRRRRLPIGILLFVAVLVAGWTAAWTWARSRGLEEMDVQLARLAARGVTIVCPERAVGGWPFRLEVSCRDPGVEIAAQGVGGSVAALRVVAQIWDPKLVLFEADGPLVADAAGRARVDATWRRLSASLRLRPGGVERLSLSVEGIDATARSGEGRVDHLKAEHLEAHGRTSGERGGDVDVALSAAAATLELAGRRIGPPRSDVGLDATFHDLLPPGPGEPLAVFAARGGRIAPVHARFAVGGVRVEGKGEVTLGLDGLLDGSIAFVGQGLEAVVTQAAALGPETASLLGGFVLLGKPSQDPEMPGRRLDLVIDHGRPRFGRLQLPAMAPLFQPRGS